jgi:IS5 family transposase
VPLYCEFAQLDAGITRLPDESTILRFRHLLEAHNLSAQLLATINRNPTALRNSCKCAGIATSPIVENHWIPQTCC